MTPKLDPLAARKELLILRAQMERLELSEHVIDFKKQFVFLNVAKKFVSWLSMNRMQGLSPMSVVSSQLLQSNLKKYPVLGSLAAAAFFSARVPVLRTVVATGAVAVVLGAALIWFNKRSDEKIR